MLICGRLSFLTPTLPPLVYKFLGFMLYTVQGLISLHFGLQLHYFLKIKTSKLQFVASLIILTAGLIDSVNLMTCMGSMSKIVKERPVYMRRVVQGFESLHGMICHHYFPIYNCELLIQSPYFGEQYGVLNCI